jgi:Uma2 family endonuclease
MALELADRPVRPITVDEALHMLDAGVFADPKRLELLLGVITEKPVKSIEHEAVKKRLVRWLWALGPEVVRFEGPIVAPDGISMPEPDLAVVNAASEAGHPTTARLVIEVAKTSYRVDTTVKPAIYASMGVPDYWVVDVVGRRVIVFREPRPNGYATQTVHVAPEQLQPVAVDIAPLDLGTLFA